MSPTRPYEEHLHRELQDPHLAAEYLSDCMHESPEAFLIALRDVVSARTLALTSLSNETGVSRKQLHRIMSQDGNPTLSTLEAMLDALGFEINVVPKQDTETAA